jgi:hypothetical protein
MDTAPITAAVTAALTDFESALPAAYFADGEGMDEDEFQTLTEAHTAFRDLLFSLSEI